MLIVPFHVPCSMLNVSCSPYSMFHVWLLCCQLRRAVDLMQPDTDIAGFIEDYVYANGAPNPSPAYMYQLSATPKEIESGMLEGNPNSVFRSTLQHVMELQKVKRATTHSVATV